MKQEKLHRDDWEDSILFEDYMQQRELDNEENEEDDEGIDSETILDDMYDEIRGKSDSNCSRLVY